MSKERKHKKALKAVLGTLEYKTMRQDMRKDYQCGITAFLALRATPQYKAWLEAQDD